MDQQLAQQSQPPQQLHMLWPERLMPAPPEPSLNPDYELRVFRPEDAGAYLALMHGAGFTQFDAEALKKWLDRVLPDGFFVVVYRPTGELAATALAAHNPSPLHPFGGELGWVAGSPAHAGRGLGRAVCAAVVRRFVCAGYRRIYLKTDDLRLPALKVYLGLGFVPFLFADDMPGRWQAICEKLSWPFTPEQWA
jgi:mycothiol synthase